MPRLGESFEANLTFEWLSPSMDNHVLLEFRLSGELLVTAVTLKRLIAGMEEFVPLEMTFIGESFIANIALVHRCCGLIH